MRDFSRPLEPDRESSLPRFSHLIPEPETADRALRAERGSDYKRLENKLVLFILENHNLIIHSLKLENNKTRPGVDKVKPKVWFKYSLSLKSISII